MARRHPLNKKRCKRQNRSAASARTRRVSVGGKRSRGAAEKAQPYIPPEDWYEPAEEDAFYRIVVQEPGDGYRHVVTADDVRERLALLPDFMLAPLEVVQLSRMTRKKKTFPCYGMQWGASLYLYPIETCLVETYNRPPRPAELTEAKMYGANWRQDGPDWWSLVWNEESIRDFYLNNVLIHELGHLLDDRNSSYADRERYAEWFAIQYGYKPSRERELARRALQRVRRHHA